MDAAAQPEAPGNETDRWTYALDALAERVAALVQADRSADDVADHQRGRVFPTAMILRVVSDITAPRPAQPAGTITRADAATCRPPRT